MGNTNPQGCANQRFTSTQAETRELLKDTAVVRVSRLFCVAYSYRRS
jgi:hypothetical protein